MSSEIAGYFIQDVLAMNKARVSKRHLEKLEEDFSLSLKIYTARKNNSLEDFHEIAILIETYLMEVGAKAELIKVFTLWRARWAKAIANRYMGTE